MSILQICTYILKLCENYSAKWKLIFNVAKCNWYLHGKSIISDAKFTLNENHIKRVGNLIHLGPPIGNQKHIEEFFCEKFKKVEKSFYSLSSVGCNSKGLNYFIVSNIYKKFCQSIFYYGLETNYFRKDCLKKLDLRQSIFIKNIFGLSKYSKTTPLLKALNIKSKVQLYIKANKNELDEK